MDYLQYSEEDILERVDEYTLYCFYLGFEPLIGAKYKSPIRDKEEDDPSWGMFDRPSDKFGTHYEYVWKDQGLGISGNIFGLVMKLFSYGTRREALLKVCADHGLGGENHDNIQKVTIEPRYADPIDIEVASRPFNERDLVFWRQFNITEAILKEYTTTAIKCYWIAKEQKLPSYPPVSGGYAYREWDKYQLYFPYAEKKKKFRNNYTEACLHGWKQLRRNTDLCIITKSRKDVMCLRSFGYDAISPRSESTMVPQPYLQQLEKDYKRILVLFDNDMKHKGDAYPYPKIYVPTTLRPDDKDVSDFCKHHYAQETAEMLKTIIRNG